MPDYTLHIIGHVSPAALYVVVAAVICHAMLLAYWLEYC